MIKHFLLAALLLAPLAALCDADGKTEPPIQCSCKPHPETHSLFQLLTSTTGL